MKIRSDKTTKNYWRKPDPISLVYARTQKGKKAPIASRHIVSGRRSAEAAAYLLRAKGGWVGTSVVVRSSAVHVPVSSRGFSTAPVSSSSTFPLYTVVRRSTAPSPPFQDKIKTLEAGKLEERDFFLCGTSIWFSKAMVQASPFSSLEHATSYARDLWFNRSPIQSWLDVFSAHLHIDEAAKFAPGPIMLELEQFGRKYRRKFGFVFITSTNKKLSHQILDEVKARYENPLSVEIGITSREEFILIERKLARLWDRLIQENVRETPEESGEVVQDSMEEDDVVNNDSSEEVVSTVNKAPKITFDLNKIPEENCFV
ncbi:hypothetical protein Ahy_B05g077255 isoform C [Arachis hypogaea]|uniref:2-oxo-4-hydroxy-4-carboxy-5-ureidoimidazoline decarboxylase n=2 Tax=Arachis TaxID=3817 RepID=A0A444Z4P5_ARAHY|nr:hypothetical protein Ahy_B05g077255 isoform C [Arachis hypogaea]